MRKNAAIYPFCPEILPAVKLFEALQKTYSIRYLVSPRGFGYSGKDAGYACNHPDTGLTVSDEIPYETSDWDTLLLFSPMIKKGTVPWKDIAEQAVSHEKNIVYLQSEGESLPEEIAQLLQGNADHITVKEYPWEPSGEEEQNFYEPEVPVVLVAGLLEEADCFDVLLQLCLKMRAEGWKPAVFSRHPVGSLFGFYSLDHIWNQGVYREAEKIKQINYYINDVARKAGSNIILMEAPDPLMKYNDYALNNFGIRTYMLCQSVTPDFLIGCIPFEVADPDFLDAIRQDFECRLGTDLCAVHVSNVLLDSFDVMQKKETEILRVNLDFVRQKFTRPREENDTAVPMFNVVEDGIDGLYDVLINSR